MTFIDIPSYSEACRYLASRGSNEVLAATARVMSTKGKIYPTSPFMIKDISFGHSEHRVQLSINGAAFQILDLPVVVAMVMKTHW